MAGARERIMCVQGRTGSADFGMHKSLGRRGPLMAWRGRDLSVELYVHHSRLRECSRGHDIQERGDR
jgi:hypothetical protein